ASLGVQPCRLAIRFSRWPLLAGNRILITIESVAIIYYNVIVASNVILRRCSVKQRERNGPYRKQSIAAGENGPSSPQQLPDARTARIPALFRPATLLRPGK